MGRIGLIAVALVLLAGSVYLWRDARRTDDNVLSFAAWGAFVLAILLVLLAIVQPRYATRFALPMVDVAPAQLRGEPPMGSADSCFADRDFSTRGARAAIADPLGGPCPEAVERPFGKVDRDQP